MPFTSSSKLLQKKWDERKYKMHVEKMKSMRPKINNEEPRKYPHMVLRLKKVQKVEERQAQIDHQNDILLQKMTTIMRNKGTVDNWNEYEKKSLNRNARFSQKEAIANENIKIAKRLESIKPKFSHDTLEEEYQRHEYLQKMWDKSTKDYDLSPRTRRRHNYDDETDDTRSLFTPRNRFQDTSRENTRATQSTGQRSSRRKDKLPPIDRDSVATNDAKMLFKATKGLVRPEEALLRALIRRSHTQRLNVIDQFEDIYDLDLRDELKENLPNDYSVLIDCLLTDRQEQDIEDVHAAVQANDYITLTEMFISRTSVQLTALSKAYKRSYGVLSEDLRDMYDDEAAKFLVALLKGQRPQGGKTDEDLAETDATELYEWIQSGEGRFTDEDGKFMEIISSRGIQQIKQTFIMYKRVTGGETIVRSMKDEDCSTDFVKAVEHMNSHMQHGHATLAEKIHGMLKPNREDLITLLLAHSELDMPAIRKAYKKKYTTELIDDIMEKCGTAGPLIAQIAAKGQATPAGGGAKGGVKAVKPAAKKPVKPAAAKKEPKQPDSQRTTGRTQSQADSSRKTPQTPAKKSQTPVSQRGGTSHSNRGASRDASSDATRIHEAIQGFGTDEGPLIEILTRRNNKERQALRKEYKEKYDKDLVEVMGGELSGDFEELTQGLLMTPREYDVYCLYESMEGLGTTESILISILCTRSGKELQAIKSAYQNKYNKDLEDDIRSDTSGDFTDLLIQLLKGERDQGTSVDQDLAETEARALIREGKDFIDLNDEPFKNLMTLRNKAQVRATFDKYEELSGQTVEVGITRAMIGDAEDAYVYLARVVQDPVDFFARRLHDAMSGMGTNDTVLIRIIVSRSEIDLPQIKARYKELYNTPLAESIKNECRGEYRDMLLALLK